MTQIARHLSVSIERAPSDVYAFVSDPANLPQWAAGLSGSIKQVEGEWVAESPMGAVKVKFADRNPFGVLDHEVTLPSGVTVLNPMRVFPNAEDSEVVFTLYRRPGMSEHDFVADGDQVQKDLGRLKALMEA
ncbi:MAG TPA: SRPBCC family protein [Chloroflexota bacterium]|nr:SRPBCC family protein [Chloroflexota bacterium]